WCWTPEFGDWLRSHGVEAEVHAVGPIMFHLPEPAQDRDPGEVVVCVFDVTAISDEYIAQKGFGWLYYGSSTCIRSLEEIILAAQQLGRERQRRVRVLVKHKRSYAWVHSKSYIDRISAWVESGAIEVVPPESNIFSLVASSDLVVAAPFTSAAMVGDFVGT